MRTTRGIHTPRAAFPPAESQPLLLPAIIGSRSPSPEELVIIIETPTLAKLTDEVDVTDAVENILVVVILFSVSDSLTTLVLVINAEPECILLL